MAVGLLLALVAAVGVWLDPGEIALLPHWERIQRLAASLGRDGRRLLQAHLDVRFHPGNNFPFLDHYRRVAGPDVGADAALVVGDRSAKTLHVVTNETQATAIWGLALHRGTPLPTVVITGGAHRLDWLYGPQISAIISQAERVVIHSSWQNTPDAQKYIDIGHAAQVDAVRTLRAGQPIDTVKAWRPPKGVTVDVSGFYANEQYLDGATKVLVEDLRQQGRNFTATLSP